MGIIKIECGAEMMDRVTAFYILKELLGFVLFMHHQIPDTIEQLERECENLVISNNENPACNSNQRLQRGKARKALRDMKKRGKLINSIQILLSALRAALQELPNISSVLLVLGSSPKRPLEAYEVQFLGMISGLATSPLLCQGTADEPCKARDIKPESLSKKITRALISHDGGFLLTGSTKLFLLIKAPVSSYVSQHFAPKRGYILPTRKVHPTVIQLLCAAVLKSDGESDITQTSAMTSCSTSHDGTICSDEMIWFQCNKNVKGHYCKIMD